ncbi:hypothetical protein AN958_02344 [Leucoagaricus sp. SymC.cos]|nr:hypothetical protein AN958_02344 [Leucoagaricus sp. SymC.cos]
MTLSFTAAWIFGSYCEAIFYGVYLTTCTSCVRILLMTGRRREEWCRRPSEIRWRLAAVWFILFLVCTFDIAMAFSRNFSVSMESNGDIGRVLMTHWSSLGQVSITYSQNKLIVLTLCWIVYGCCWPVVIPSALLFLANIAISLRAIVLIAAPGEPEMPSSSSSGALRTLLLSFCSTIAAQNILTTGLMIRRIWLVERETLILEAEDRPRYFHQVRVVLIESGATYTAIVLLTLILTAAHSVALFLVETSMIQVAGIAFNMILVRCSPERDQQFSMFHNKELSTLVIAHQRTTLISELMVSDRRDTTRDGREPMGTNSEHDTNEQSSHNDFESKDIRTTRKVVSVKAHV